MFLHRKLSEQLELKHGLLALILSALLFEVIRAYCMKNTIGLKFVGFQGKSANRNSYAKYI